MGQCNVSCSSQCSDVSLWAGDPCNELTIQHKHLTNTASDGPLMKAIFQRTTSSEEGCVVTVALDNASKNQMSEATLALPTVARHMAKQPDAVDTSNITGTVEGTTSNRIETQTDLAAMCCQMANQVVAFAKQGNVCACNPDSFPASTEETIASNLVYAQPSITASPSTEFVVDQSSASILKDAIPRNGEVSCWIGCGNMPAKFGKACLLAAVGFMEVMLMALQEVFTGEEHIEVTLARGTTIHRWESLQSIPEEEEEEEDEEKLQEDDKQIVEKGAEGTPLVMNVGKPPRGSQPTFSPESTEAPISDTNSAYRLLVEEEAGEEEKELC